MRNRLHRPGRRAAPDRRIQPLARRGGRGHQRRRLRRAGRVGLYPGRARRPADLDRRADRGQALRRDLLVPEKFAAATRPTWWRACAPRSRTGTWPSSPICSTGTGSPSPGNPEHDEIAASLNPDGAAPLLDVAFRHPIRLIANALGPPPAGLVDRARKQGVPVAALVGQPRHAIRQLEAALTC
jgi:hypothetical protein